MNPLRVISELFYPSGIKCVVCGDDLPVKTRYCICDKCELSHNTKYCLRCGRAMKNMADYCDDCKDYSVEFDFARAPFVYENEIKDLVRRLKYGSGRYLAEVMAEFMADVYVENGFKADVVTFVPMPDKRQKKRGYNQGFEIAEKLSALIGVPCEQTLRRIKEPENLARMGKKERLAAIEGSFGIVDGSDVKGKNILLVDDVFTTGATANECSKILKKNKCGQIFVLTFATARIKPELY